jgi:hypothetical protein
MASACSSTDEIKYAFHLYPVSFFFNICVLLLLLETELLFIIVTPRAESNNRQSTHL